MRNLILVGAALVSLCSASLVRGVVILSDSFNYTDGSIVGATGSPWIHVSGTTTGEVKVVSGRVFLSQTNAEDISAPLVGQPYPPTSGTILYASFVINFRSYPSGAGGYFAHFKTGGTSGFADKIFATTNGVAPGFYRVGVANSSNGPSILINSNLTLNTDYTLVTRFAVSNANSTLWLNPAAETDPGVTAVDTATTITTTTFALRESLATGDGMGSLFVDNLVVGTNFSDVVPSTGPPFIAAQPQGQTVVEGDNVSITVSAAGAAPLAYQWLFYGTNLDGATDAVLALPNVSTNQAGPYQVVITNALGTTNSDVADLVVNVQDHSVSLPAFAYLTYNMKGNGATNWSTNAPQVQAIGREIMYLNPDVITLNEVPNQFTYEMANFVAAFLPGYHLATNSATDGFIRSAIVSRFPIIFSKSYLHSADLGPYGYTNSDFTRDLFQAQVAVPAFPQPLNVFVVHLKSGQDTDSSSKRGAEASAVSNFFATVFLATNTLQPYVLSGDMNEDIDNPPSSHPMSIERLVNSATGLQLTSPLNPFSNSPLTFSIQSVNGLTHRYDYIMPSPLLYSNINSSQVFRTDLLPNPPPPLLPGDDATASDHLPVYMVFANPYSKPFRLTSVSRSSNTLGLTWQTVLGQPYRLEASSNLSDWAVLAQNLVATGASYSFSTNVTLPVQFFRVYRQP